MKPQAGSYNSNVFNEVVSPTTSDILTTSTTATALKRSQVLQLMSDPLSFTGETANQVEGVLVTGNYFSVLNVKPTVGRLITPENDGTPGEHPVAVLGYGFWQRAFAGGDVVGARSR